jgi:outer membrane immunogenic protein
MRSLILATAALVFASPILDSPILAADLASVKEPPVFVETPFAFSGFYAGVGGGYVWSRATTGYAAMTAVYGSAPAPSGGFAAIRAGILAPMANHVVAGVEAEILPGGASTTVGIPGVSRLTTTANVAGTLQTRVGYELGKWLPYVSFGLAFAQNHANGVNPYHPQGFTADAVHLGGAIGGGVEYAFSGQWTARLSYSYLVFGDADYVGNPRAANAQFIGAGVNYFFGR